MKGAAHAGVLAVSEDLGLVADCPAGVAVGMLAVLHSTGKITEWLK